MLVLAGQLYTKAKKSFACFCRGLINQTPTLKNYY